MNDLVDDIHSDIEYPIEHYEQDRESMNRSKINCCSQINQHYTYRKKCMNKIGFDSR